MLKNTFLIILMLFGICSIISTIAYLGFDYKWWTTTNDIKGFFIFLGHLCAVCWGAWAYEEVSGHKISES